MGREKQPYEETAGGRRVRNEAERESEEKRLRGCTPESLTELCAAGKSENAGKGRGCP